MANKPILFRIEDELREEGEKQAAKLGLNLSEYLRLCIKVDIATEIIKRLKEE